MRQETPLFYRIVILGEKCPLFRKFKAKRCVRKKFSATALLDLIRPCSWGNAECYGIK